MFRFCSCSVIMKFQNMNKGWCLMEKTELKLTVELLIEAGIDPEALARKILQIENKEEIHCVAFRKLNSGLACSSCVLSVHNQ